jgi:ABC-type phosphate transport system substrate-binding protein
VRAHPTRVSIAAVEPVAGRTGDTLRLPSMNSGLCLLVAALPLLAPQELFKVVVHPAHSPATVDRKTLAEVFLKKAAKWADGTAATPVDQVDRSDVRQAFSREVLGKSVSAVKNYWQQAIFSGRGVPPVEKKTDLDVIVFVQSTPGAVGYVSATAPTGKAKVLQVEH